MQEYIVYDEETGREITRVQDIGTARLYQENPNYDSKLIIEN